MLRHRTDWRKKLNQLFSVQTRRIDLGGPCQSLSVGMAGRGKWLHHRLQQSADLTSTHYTHNQTYQCTTRLQTDRSVTKTYVFDDYSAFLLFVNEIVVNGPFVEKFFSICRVKLYCPFLRSIAQEKSNHKILLKIQKKTLKICISPLRELSISFS